MLRQHRHKVHAAFLLIGFVLEPTWALACSCMPFPADEAKAAASAYALADVIFLGTVKSTVSRRLSHLAVRDTTFEVQQSWKGLNGLDAVVVRSANGEIACGYRFRKPGDYLVFAYWDADRHIFTTSMCDLNREASKAQSLISALDRITQKKKPIAQREPVT